MRSIDSMKNIVLFGLFSLMMFGCVRNNPKPVWLDLSEWQIEDNPNLIEGPGYLNHNFTDVWVYVDNKLLGVFELPCKIPVLITGENKSIRLYPTIRNNGISGTKKIYPFCEAFEQTYNLVSGSTISIQPVTRYASNCQFWLEDFESSSSKFITDLVNSNTTMTFENDPAISLDGTYGHISLNGSTDSLWRGISVDPIQLPKYSAEVYMEVDYHNTVNILQGLQTVYSDGSTVENPFGQMNNQDVGSAKWKKIYFDLKEIVSYYTLSSGYKPTLQSVIQEATGSAEIYIDNIRLVHF